MVVENPESSQSQNVAAFGSRRRKSAVNRPWAQPFVNVPAFHTPDKGEQPPTFFEAQCPTRISKSIPSRNQVCSEAIRRSDYCARFRRAQRRHIKPAQLPYRKQTHVRKRNPAEKVFHSRLRSNFTRIGAGIPAQKRSWKIEDISKADIKRRFSSFLRAEARARPICLPVGKEELNA